MNLYPLTFTPLFKEKIWGGDKIKNSFNQKSLSNGAIGESWPLCCRKDEDSIVANGTYAGMPLSRLLFAYPKELLGNAVYERYGARFPLLFKFIDAKQNLSIQVHPAHTNTFGASKNEFWYVIESIKHAALFVGLAKDVGKTQLADALTQGTLTSITQKICADSGDFINVPAGQIHAITSGFFVAEISENSDTTYRLYDWGRIDEETGNPRPLHTKEALAAIDYTYLSAEQITTVSDINTNIQQGPKINEFMTERRTIINSEVMCSDKDGFRVFLCISGQAEVFTNTDMLLLKPGYAALIPAALGEFIIDGNATLLHTYYKQKE